MDGPPTCAHTLAFARHTTIGSAPIRPSPLMQGCQRLLARLPTLTARAVAGKPLGAAARVGATHPLRTRGAQQRQCLCTAAAVPPIVATDKMATSNGGSVTSEEVEQLRAQLETLQVRAVACQPAMHMPLPARARCRLPSTHTPPNAERSPFPTLPPSLPALP